MKRKQTIRTRSHLDFLRLENRQMLASLANGQEVITSIPIGGQETFDFQVNTAGTVIVSVGETSNVGANPFLELFGPGGVSLGTSTSETNATLQFVDIQPGTYTAVVSDEFGDEGLNFRIRALTLPEAPELIARDNVLANGEEFVSSVPVGGLAIYPLEVNTAGTVVVSVGETSNVGANPFLELFAPGGVSLGTSTSETNASLQFVDLQPGTYTAVVSDQNGNEGLDFRIRALALPDAPELIARDNVLAYGEEFVSSIPVGGLAVYPIEVNRAGTVVVSVEETSNFSADPFLELFGPRGVSLGTSTSETDAALQFVNLQPGTYTAIVSDQFGDQGLGFRITAEFEDLFVLGDADLNGVVDFADIPAFIDVLTSGNFLDEADTDRDGDVDFSDIPPFIDILSSVGSAQSSFALSYSVAPVISSGSVVTSQPILVESPVSSVVSVAQPDSVASVASSVEVPIASEADFATNSLASPVAETSQLSTVDVTIADEAPADTNSGPAAFAPVEYSSLKAIHSSLRGFQSDRPLVVRQSLAGSTERLDLPSESSNTNPGANESIEKSYSTTAELFDADPKTLDDVFDF